MLSRKVFSYKLGLIVAASLVMFCSCGNGAANDIEAHAWRSLGGSGRFIAMDNSRLGYTEPCDYKDPYSSRTREYCKRLFRLHRLTDSVDKTVRLMHKALMEHDRPTLSSQQEALLLQRLREYRLQVMQQLPDTSRIKNDFDRRRAGAQVVAIDSLMLSWETTVVAGHNEEYLMELLLLDIQLLKAQISDALWYILPYAVICGIRWNDIPLAIFQSENVVAGDTVRLITGFGNYATAGIITVQLDTAVVSYSGQAGIVLPVQAAYKPGLHKLPVSITWLRPDSTTLTWTKNIQYAVAP